MIKMYISKSEDGHILMAKPDDNMFKDIINLTDVVKIIFMQTPQGITPVPCYYPNMVTKDIIKKDVLNKIDVIIDIREYVTFAEEEIVNDMLELYKNEINKREGVPPIQIVGHVPPNLKLVR